MSPLACSSALGIAALALLHAAWALGFTWPARDKQHLARVVVGRLADARMPGAAPCLAVAALLGLSALLVSAAAGGVRLAVPMGLVRVGTYGVMVAFLLRGVVGLFAEQLQPALRGSAFARYNRLVYSPLALALGLLVLLTLRAS